MYGLRELGNDILNQQLNFFWYFFHFFLVILIFFFIIFCIENIFQKWKI